MAHPRTVAAIDDPGRLSLDEIIATGAAESEGGQPWRASVDTFNLFGSPTEELDRLEPREIIGAYYAQVGVKWDGGTLLHSGVKDSSSVGKEALHA